MALRFLTLALRLHQRRIPAPQVIVGQPRAAPPAINRIVSAEVFLVSQNRLAEFGERQPASLVCRETSPEILPRERTQSIIQARDGRPGPVRQPIEQVADFEFSENARAAERPQMKQRIRILEPPR